MTPRGQITEKADQLGIPWDLRDWFPEFTLVNWIDENLESIDWNNPRLVEFLKGHPEFRPRPLLHLLVYAYAIGLYASEDLVNACYEEPTLRGICQHAAPTGRELLIFRRSNRTLIRYFLAQLYRRALRLKSDIGDRILPAGLKQRIDEAAMRRIEIAQHMDRLAVG